MVESSTNESRCLPFRRAAVIGAGVMGGQIAAHLANAGLAVDLLDIPAKEGDKNAIVAGAFKRLGKLKPPPFFTKEVSQRIRLGNLEDDIARLGEADWIIEVVVERLDIKRSLLEKIEEHASADAVITSNTSGLPIADICAERSGAFRKRFLGTHFFNPPRYLPLFEIIPTGDTDPAIVQRVSEFARVRLGKGVVVAKDTPNFIGNRIGVFSMMLALSALDRGFTIEEVDALTGPLIGRAKSATFRTADVVGLDTLVHVAKNLYEAVPKDESREVFAVSPLLEALVDKGALGQKAGAGFYRKQGREILSIDPKTGEYRAAAELDLGDIGKIKKVGDLGERLRLLFVDEGRAGGLFRWLILETLGYAARRLPEISESPADVDRAIRWGFGWKLGPFEVWDALGFDAVREAMKKADVSLPAWIDAMAAAGADSFYRGSAASVEVFLPSGAYAEDPRPADELTVAALEVSPGRRVWENPEAALHDMGEGVALFEFRSKANSLSQKVMEGLGEALDIVEKGPWKGLVIGNDGDNFSVGANLGEMAQMAQAGDFAGIGTLIERFQEVVQRVRYAPKPVVVAAHGKTLGGGCELVLACPHPVASAETYPGLVELGVGLIPAGSGTTRMAAWASARAGAPKPTIVQGFLADAFSAIAMAKVGMGARDAQRLGLLSPAAPVVMNPARRLHVAKHEVLRLDAQGFEPPTPVDEVFVLGRSGRAQLEQVAYNMREGRFASDYDRFLATRVAWVMTGGDISGPQMVPERYLLGLEREVFLQLLKETKTHERIESILTTNKPLRN